MQLQLVRCSGVVCALAVLALGVSSCGGQVFTQQSPAANGSSTDIRRAAARDADAGAAHSSKPVDPPQTEQAGSESNSTTASTAALRKRPVRPQPTSVGRYEVLELSFPYRSAGLGNPWEDVAVTAAFRTPAGRLIMVEGFFYDADDYRVRFAPTELGEYEYSVDLRGPWGNETQSGKFTVSPSSRKGFIRKLASNPYRLVYDDGTIFNGIGLNDCWNANVPGGLGGFVEENTQASLADYLALYGARGAGFNVLRWNPGNCSFDIYETLSNQGNSYGVRESKLADQLLATATANGFHVMFDFFYKPPDPTLEEAYKRAVRYVMARYGAYVDIWELTNETEEKFPMSFIQVFTAYVKQLDPNKRLVTNSYERVGDWNVLDARSPHIQVEVNDGVADMRKYTNDYTTNAPVISGETYNPGNHNSDAHSTQRMRMYAWTAFFGGLIDVWWNTSYKRHAPNVPGNMYIGAQERRCVYVLQKLSAQVPPSSELSTLEVGGGSATGYALRGTNMALVYLYRPFGARRAAATFSLDVPVDGLAWFIDPATGEAVHQTPVRRGMHKFTTPPFAEDLVVQIE